MKQTIYKFQTRRFIVEVVALPEDCLDLSWDATGETARKIEAGELCAFQVEARVSFCGEYGAPIKLGADYLGGCVYESPDAFRDHFGVRPYERELSASAGGPVSVCRYFSSMVREAIARARCNMDTIAHANN
jgi:flavin-binding protein dodecin